MLMNRIADVFFIFGIVLILYYFKTLNYLLVFSLIDYIQEYYIFILFSAIVDTYQYDIKKIIAYSTCSQLSYMFFSSGLSNYNITLFHLFNHAFFKALLFLGAGSIISSLLDEQDMRKMGSLVYKMPFTYLSIVIGSLAICGFPFLAGFLSKDLLLEATFISYSLDSIFVGIGSDYFNNSIYIKYEHFNNMEIEFISPFFKNLPFILTFLGLLLSYYFFYILYIINKQLNFLHFIIKKKLYEIFYNAGFFNFFYNRIYLYFFNLFYKINVKYIEKGFFEIFGPIGLYLFFRDLSYKARFISPYFVNISLFLIYFNLILILYFIILKNIYFLLFFYYLIIDK